MVPYLVSSYELEEIIRTFIVNEGSGVCFHAEVGNMVDHMVDHYNRSESECLLDTVIESVRDKLDDYSHADLIVSRFLRLIESNADVSRVRVRLEFRAKESTIVVRHVRRPPPDPILKLTEEYRHATEQGDFIPERLRRAFEELLS